MRVPLKWLQEFVDLPTTDVDELTYAFDMLGLTVEGVEMLEADWSEVYVGRVTEIAAHPDADKVRVCQVDTGSGPEQIICGAWNFEEGAIVAVAKPGAVLPGDFEIGQRTIRGVESNGMICSESELGLGEDHAGILVLDGDPELGSPFSDQVELPDVVFDLEVTPNRADAMSIMGVARDLAAYFDVGYRVPEIEMETVEGRTEIEVSIEAPAGCPRFTAREITGVTIGPAPLWMRHRLNKVGVRSISNVVDVTNYVMFELGHPLHAFDADSIVGNRLTIKRAVTGESLVTLDGDERSLSEDDLIIYDSAGPTSMSGTMGGARSEVSDATGRVLMEAASWHPPTIMGMSRRHNLRSEASTRFERGVDPNLANLANRRASALVAMIGGGEVLEGAVDELATVIEPVVIEITSHDVERILGPGFDEDYIAGLLKRLELGIEGRDPILVTVPTFRPDLSRVADLVEEIARIHGFDNFAATLPTGPWGGQTREQRRFRVLQQTLAGVGCNQAINLPFVSVEDLVQLGRRESESDLLTVKNPLHEEESKLRPTILPGLLNSLRYNLSHGADSVALFETGKVFFTNPSEWDPRLPEQVERLAWVAVGDVGLDSLGGTRTKADGALSLAIWHRVADALNLVDVELTSASAPGFHPGRCARVSIGGTVVGHVGELSPRAARAYEIADRVAIAELDVVPIIAEVPYVEGRTPSVFPHVDFDLSFLMNTDSAVVGLVDATTAAAGGLVESAKVFDEYRGSSLEAGKRAIAIRYRLRGDDRTLTAEEIAPIREAMITAAADIGATLRGV
ncbi:MAG: phenylalanine--tRNA ligase subunit beta [Actinomycetota bacterium]|nr:phenylalanine--tRNA ligase subunit beta [Actinomycetota bacterium]